jgi:RNA polymerase sigma-70 factor (ECF subfamily)
MIAKQDTGLRKADPTPMAREQPAPDFLLQGGDLPADRGLDPGRPFLPWLLAIARNRMVDGARRYVRRSANEVAVEQLPVTFAEDEANVSGDAYGDPEALRQAMQRLPRGQREAIEMLKLREMSLREAAGATGLSMAALKVAVHRGMNALRKALATES